MNDHRRALPTFVLIQIPDVLGWSSFPQDIKHSCHLEVLFCLFIGHWLLFSTKLFAPLLVLCNSFHRRQSGILPGLVNTFSVIGMWALTSLLDKFHFMVTFAVHILLECSMSVLVFMFVYCKPMLLTGFVHKGVEV